MPAVLDDLARYSPLLRHLGEYRPAGGGLTFRCPLHARHRNGDRNPSCRAFVGRDGALILRCMGCGAAFGELAPALGIDPRACYPHSGKRAWRMDTGPRPRLVATYQYRSHDGTLLYEKQRWEPGMHNRKKDFVARRPLPDDWRRRLNCPAGQEAWVYGLGADEYCRPKNEPTCWEFRKLAGKLVPQEGIALDAVTPVLYRLPELAAANPAAPVFVVEGEGDVDLLRSLGFVATCGHAGANTWLAEWSHEFRGRRVVVVPDHNVVGYQHADRVAGSVIRAGAASVRVLQWDDEDPNYNPGDGGGVKNWLEKTQPAYPKTDLIGFVKGATEFTGTPVHVEAGRATGQGGGT